jgi:hypothetical protein
MSTNKKIDRSKVRIINSRKKARDIVKEVINFGVSEEEILHIIYLFALNLEDIDKMKNISSIVKKYTEDINTDDKEDNIKSKSKIILQ